MVIQPYIEWKIDESRDVLVITHSDLVNFGQESVNGFYEESRLDVENSLITKSYDKTNGAVTLIKTPKGKAYFSALRRSIKMSEEKEVEAKIVAKGLTAARITPEMIDATIVGEQYWIPEGTVTTVCCLVLKNEFTVIGMSAPASPSNFDPELGREIARRNAREQIWRLEGYSLRQRLHEAK